jgi:hypothetical protein
MRCFENNYVVLRCSSPRAVPPNDSDSVVTALTVMFRRLARELDQDLQSINQSISMTSRRYIIYCAKRWPNRAGSAMPVARTLLRKSEEVGDDM